LGHGPQKGHQFTGDGDHDLVGMVPACHEVANACAHAYLRLPTEVLERLRERFQSELPVACADGPEGDDLGTVLVRDRGHGNGRLMDISVDVQRARLRHG
jgi:hypothetical protein